jgi:Sec7-like guanine-nucleotide exchange factor
MDWMTSVTTIVAASLSSGTVAALVGAVAARKAKYRDADQSLITAVRLLLQDRIEYLGLSYIALKSIPHSKKEFLRIAHKCFRGLGGGDELNSIMDDVNELEVEYPQVGINRKA